MDYLYADGSRFPLPLNFIDLLKDSIDCAVGLLAIHDRVASTSERLAAAEHQSTEVLDQLSTFQQAVERVVERPPLGCEHAAEQIRELVARVTLTERGLVDARRREEMAGIAREAEGQRAEVLRALEQLLRRQDLP